MRPVIRAIRVIRGKTVFFWLPKQDQGVIIYHESHESNE